jgi:hypothetical protein
MTPLSAYDELCCYTLSRGDVEFVHQHVVDAHAAQTATVADKPIRLTFALIGLCLHLDHAFTGKEVQLAHMKLARNKAEWPRFEIPELRGRITAFDVLAVPPGAERDAAISDWCAVVWRAYEPQRDIIVELLERANLIPAAERQQENSQT